MATETSGSTTVINRMPALEPHRDVAVNPYHETVSHLSADIRVQPWGVDSEHDKKILNKLKDELVFGELHPNMGRSLYDISLHIAETVLAMDDSTGEVIGLLDASKPFTRPMIYHDIDKEDPAGSHNEVRREFGLNLGMLAENAKEIVVAAKESDIELLDNKDAYLISFLSIGAHETGHAQLAGIGRLAKEVGGPRKSLLSTRIYMANHPEMSMTGKWQSDVLTHEERFAEGYGDMVLESALLTLGYSPELTRRLLDLMQPSGTISVEEGGLGYENPLTREQIISQLVEISEITKQHDFPELLQDDETWGSKIKAAKISDSSKKNKMPLHGKHFAKETAPNKAHRIKSTGRMALKGFARFHRKRNSK